MSKLLGMHHAARKIAIAFLVGVIATVGLATEAQADTTRAYENAAVSKCLDSNAAQDVYTRACNGGSYQKWIYGSASYQLKNVATGYCLDSNSAGSVYVRGCNAGNFQKWRRYGVQFANVATGLCLDVRTSGVWDPYTHACNTGYYQAWIAR